MRMSDCHPGKKYFAKGLCKRCYYKARGLTPEYKAYSKARRQTPEYRAKMKVYNRAYHATPGARASARARKATPETKAWEKVYNATPERKAKKRDYRSTPEAKEKARVYNAMPKTKARQRERNATPDARARNKARIQYRRAIKVGSIPSAGVSDIESRVLLFGNECAYCGGEYEHIDHVVALTCGGKHSPCNLVPSCARCNSSKQASPWRTWYRAQSFYDVKREMFIKQRMETT